MELTEEEKKILEKLRKDTYERKRDGEKFNPTSDPKKWEAPIGLDDDGNPYPPPDAPPDASDKKASEPSPAD